MKIKWKIGVMFGILFCILAILLWKIVRGNPILLVSAELGLLTLLIAFYVALHRIFKPLDLISTGLSALNDQDFTSQLRTTGTKEADKLVEVYNKMILNIREERRFQEEQNLFLKNLIEALPVGLIVLDFEDKIQKLNPRAGEILSLNEEDIGTSLLELPLGKELSSQVEKMPQTYLLGGARYIRTYVDRFKRRGFYQKFIIVEEASQEIIRMERASYGKVIRMMAHEVKNSVGAVNSILETLKKGNEQHAEYLQIVIDRNKRLNSFIDNFAKVVRLEKAAKEPVLLNEMVQHIFHLYPNHGIHLTLPLEEIWIQANREQLEQVLINVVLNAKEAKSTEIHLELTPSTLLIKDNGEGVPKELETSLFTPFFTTKPTGQGVGLTMVREILHHHGFDFGLETKDGWTTFWIQYSSQILKA
jgi:two-component system nitrogen regulation sensor histidine kinase NtrY